VLVGGLVVLLAGTGAAAAVELKEPSTAQASYAREVEIKDADGHVVKRCEFGTTPTTLPPQELDQILAAHGAELVDMTKAPAGYAREVEVRRPDGKMANQIVWGTTPRPLAPQELDAILTAYGLELADVDRCPASHAREVETKAADGKTAKQIVWGTAPRTLAPAELDQILAAYR
jgi:hypothetical protein